MATIKYLKDYAEPSYWVEEIHLTFIIKSISDVLVEATSLFKKNSNSKINELKLNGSAELVSIKLNNQILNHNEYILKDKLLTVLNVKDNNFSLTITTKLNPNENKTYMGLFISKGNLLTQCEPEGFRKITFYQDRPDVLAKFTTTIIANTNDFPILLSNGNETNKQIKDNILHTTFSDPFRKPCYLFALVAGKFNILHDTFKTKNNNIINLDIYVKDDVNRATHAMQSLKKAFQFDEERFDLVYDLDNYKVVASDDFNSGAMENKGLNIFNSKYILVDYKSATDNDFINVEAVIAHEYFHNYTGNRVTLRDWFQLSLKEGLTVFREQEFTYTVRSKGVTRVNDVKTLRQYQFPEDNGPLSHPVQPQSYISINNFYTTTIYEKGAEIVRMYQEIFGKDGFNKGLKFYLNRHDGSYATIFDFLNAMAEANNYDLSQFILWYQQSGTPIVNVSEVFSLKDYKITLKQVITEGNQPLLIPIKVALFDNLGNKLENFDINGNHKKIDNDVVLLLTKEEEDFVFTANFTSKPIISILRGFSAPIKLNFEQSQKDKHLLAIFDDDQFNQYENLRYFFIEGITNSYNHITNKSHNDTKQNNNLFKIISQILKKPTIDFEFYSTLLAFPNFAEMLSIIHSNVDPYILQDAINSNIIQIGESFFDSFLEIYNNLIVTHYDFKDHGKRALKNLLLQYIIKSNIHKTNNPRTLQFIETLLLGQFHNADNMTDEIATLNAINDFNIPLREQMMTEFYNKWNHNELVMDKWFSISALSQNTSVRELNKLMVDKAFIPTNPNKIYALLRSFTQNAKQFNTEEGYNFIAEQVIMIDKFNPSVASNVLQGFNNVTQLSIKFQKLAKNSLGIISNQKNLSNNAYEIVNKIINKI